MSASSENAEIAVRCLICLENYSSIRYPVVSPECGHSICVDCAMETKSNVCVTCKSVCFGLGLTEPHNYAFKKPLTSDLWKKNYGLLDIVEQYANEKSTRERAELETQRVTEELGEFKRKLEDPKADDCEFMKCPNCKNTEKRDRMKICGSCTEKWNKEWKGMRSEQILPFILCGCCCIEEHVGHSIIKYLPWKLKQLMTTTVLDGKSTVLAVNDLCDYEIANMKEQLGNWNEKMDSFQALKAFECGTYQDGLSMVNSLKTESDNIYRASEDILSALRKYTEVVENSISLLDFLQDEESVNRAEANREWFYGPK